MARTPKRSDEDVQLDRAFEAQQRRLNRKWTRNALSGVVLLIVVFIALQFTPYHDIHKVAFTAIKNLVSGLTSGSLQNEPDPKYW
ncbi:MAG: hypothetical protein Kow0099_03570 [Candidatus Abyssubacteria bacterium]